MSNASTSAFCDAVIDTICPGLGGDRPLPAATRAGLSGGTYRERHAMAFSAIATEAGGETAFLAGSPATRATILDRVGASLHVEFRSLVQAVIADYYEAQAVLAAVGWPVEPPQPRGRSLAAMDAGLDVMLERVSARGSVWRKPE